MTERDSDARRSSSRSRGQGAARWVYGGLLVAIGACIGIVIGSVSDTPRMLLERMRGPVETVELETPAQKPAAAEAAPPLEAFGELQGEKPKAAAKREVAAVTPPAAPAPAAKPAPPVKPAPVIAPPKPAPEPAVSSPPPAAPAKSSEQIMHALEAKTDAKAPPVESKRTVIQVLSLAQRSQADALVAKLRAQGFDPYATAMPDKSGRYRVRVRPTGGQDAAALEQRLKDLGLKTWATTE